MDKIKQLIPRDILNNKQLCKIFKCGSQGRRRKSNKTKMLVLITNNVESVYSDVWHGDELHYTEMGQKGDQSLDFMQNKTLNEIDSKGVTVHYFEVFKDKQYTNSHCLIRVGAPYQTEQFDIHQTLM